jgi:hypothetical protein
MKNLISILMIVFVLIIISCSSRKSKQEGESKIIKNENLQDTEKCINQELDKSIRSYLNDLDGNPYFKKNIFSIYFFSENGKKYFTIWMSQDIPYNFIHNNPNVAFKFSLLKIQDATLILITNNDIGKPELFNCETLTIDSLKEKVPKTDTLVFYDGTLFPETFEYWNNGELVVKKADSLLVEFLGREYMQYERTIKKLIR